MIGETVTFLGQCSEDVGMWPESGTPGRMHTLQGNCAPGEYAR